MSLDIAQDFAHWVYRAFDGEGRLLYVGMTSNPKARLQVWHSVGSRAQGHWWPQVKDIRWEFHDTMAAAAAAERRAIVQESPRHNVRMVPRDHPVRPSNRKRVGAERARRMLSAYVDDDMTLEQIGQRHGVTRERVRQLVTQLDPTVYKLARRRRSARTRHRRWVNAGSVARRVVCPVCGEPFETALQRQAYCSPIHRQVWVMLRYQLDERYRSDIRMNTARWYLRNSEDPAAVRHAKRVLAGEVEVGHRRRYLQIGSLNWHWAVRAYALRWPLFDMLHEDVQAQVCEHVEAST